MFANPAPITTYPDLGNSSAAEVPFGGIKDSGYGKEAGKDIAVSEYMITKSGTLTVDGLP